MHQDIQSKVYKEIVENSSENLSSFKYLDMIISEALRLFPPVPFAGRTATNDFNLDGFEIPKNSTLIISIVNMHRDGKIWGSDADSFRPERFMNENLTKEQLNAFMPFTSKIHFNFLLIVSKFSYFSLSWLSRMSWKNLRTQFN